ncbi:hypothetical protein OAK75_11740, partial [Bacteriovoracales bacterium]|nr:hypothetical protein [Bacteriovoracales bacterium]
SCKSLEGSENQSICEKKYKLTTFNKVPTGANNCEKLKSEVIFQVGYGSLDGLQVKKTIELEQSVEAVIPSHVNSETGEKIANVDSFEIPVPNIIYFDGLVKPGFEFGVKKSNFMEIKFNEDNASKKQVRFSINLKKTTIGLKNCLGLDGSKNYDLTCERNVTFDNLTIPNEGRGQIYLRMIDKNGFLSKNEIVVNVPLNEKVIGWFNGGSNGCKKRFKAKDDCLIENMMPQPYDPKYFKDKTKEELNKLLECNSYNQKVLEGVDYDSGSGDCPVVFKENGDIYGLINLAKKDFSFRSTPFMGMANCNNSIDKGNNCFVQFMNDKKNKDFYDPPIQEHLFYLMDKKFNSSSENLNPFLAKQDYTFSPSLSANQFFDAYVDGSLCHTVRNSMSQCFRPFSSRINTSGVSRCCGFNADDMTFSPTYFYVNKRESLFELLDDDFDTSIFVVYDGRFIDNYFKSINSSNPIDQIFPIYVSGWNDYLTIHCSAQERICTIKGRTEDNDCHTSIISDGGVVTKTRYCSGNFPVSNFKITEENKCKGCPIIIQVDFKFLENLKSAPVNLFKNISDLPLDKASEMFFIKAKAKRIENVFKINNEKIKFYRYDGSLPSNKKTYSEGIPERLFYMPLNLKDYLSKEIKEPTSLSTPILRESPTKIGNGYYSKNSPTLNILDIRVYKNLSEENKENIYKKLMKSYK